MEIHKWRWWEDGLLVWVLFVEFRGYIVFRTRAELAQFLYEVRGL